MVELFCDEDNPLKHTGAVHLIGIGEYGSQTVIALEQDGIRQTKYTVFDSENQDMAKLKQALCWVGAVIMISDSSYEFSEKLLSKITGVCRELNVIIILILRLPNDDYNHNHIRSANLCVETLKGAADTLFVISAVPHEEYKQIYYCVKALTDFCGDRTGLINTKLADIAGSVRKVGIGYIGFGAEQGEDAIGKATDVALLRLKRDDRLINAGSVIAAVYCQDISLENTLPLFNRMKKNMNDNAKFNYNFYLSDNAADCSVIILATGYR